MSKLTLSKIRLALSRVILSSTMPVQNMLQIDYYSLGKRFEVVAPYFPGGIVHCMVLHVMD